MAFQPAFDAAYGMNGDGCGRSEPWVLTLMITPPPPATIRSPTSADNRKGPLRVQVDHQSNSFSLTSVSLS